LEPISGINGDKDSSEQGGELKEADSIAPENDKSMLA
jgi:hypothetical protein